MNALGAIPWLHLLILVSSDSDEDVCDSPTEPVPGAEEVTTPPYDSGESLTYKCMNGYRYNSGSLTRKCSGSGEWDDSTLSCLRELLPLYLINFVCLFIKLSDAF